MIFFLEMTISPASPTSNTYDLTHVSYEEKAQIFDIYFGLLREKIENYYPVSTLKTIVSAELSKIYSDLRDQIIFRMNGIMSAKDIERLILEVL